MRRWSRDLTVSRGFKRGAESTALPRWRAARNTAPVSHVIRQLETADPVMLALLVASQDGLSNDWRDAGASRGRDRVGRRFLA